MTDEPTPPPTDEAPQVWVEPPPLPPVRRRTNVGWLVSGVMVVLYAAMAVGGYVAQSSGEKSYDELQQSLRVNVSLDPARFPALESQLENEKKEGLQEVLRAATEDAHRSDEAARIAAAAAHELDQEPPAAALDRLTSSEDEASRAIGAFYGEGDASALQGLSEEPNEEFAVRLARAHEAEKRGDASARAAVVDHGLYTRLMALTLAGATAIVLGVVALVAFIAMRATGRLRPVGLGAFDASDGDRYMVRFAMYLFVFLGASFVVAAVDALGSPVSSVWLSAGAMVGTFALVAALLRVHVLERADSVSEVVSEKRPVWKLVAFGAYGYLCTVPLLVVAIGLILFLSRILPEPTHPIGQEMASAGTLDWIGIALAAAVLAPLVEELAFRGLLFPALTTRMRPGVAMLVCGLVFASIHPQGPLAWPALATTGAAAAALRHYTGSLVPSIVLHMVHNGVIVAVSLLML